jgi:hypothetical protein
LLAVVKSDNAKTAQQLVAATHLFVIEFTRAKILKDDSAVPVLTGLRATWREPDLWPLQ